MAKTYACIDLGATCGWDTRGETEDEVVAKVLEHAAEIHPEDVITPEVIADVRAAIKGA